MITDHKMLQSYIVFTLCIQQAHLAKVVICSYGWLLHRVLQLPAFHDAFRQNLHK